MFAFVFLFKKIIIMIIYIAHLSIQMFKCTLQASTNSTAESLWFSATAAHIHLYIKNALNWL